MRVPCDHLKSIYIIMKKIYNTFLFCLVVISAHAQQKTSPMLIVRGDYTGSTRQSRIFSPVIKLKKR